MKVPFIDLKAQYLSIKEDIDQAKQAVMDDMFFIEGPRVTQFEEDFANYVGGGYCVGCSHGTDALMIALLAAGIGKGDEVIVPALSWISTAAAVSRVGATPVFIDIDPVSYCIDVNQLEEKITSKTKAIIPVHLYGQLADMESISNIAKKHHLFVLEDAAQAHGTSYKGKKAGTYGDVSIFSFYPVKTLGAYGDAGCIFSKDEEYMEKVRLIAKQGQKEERGVHHIIGMNSRLDSLQAAILSAKLPYLDKWVESRIEKAKRYHELLEDLPIDLPQIPFDKEHSFHLYVIRIPEKRDELKAYLVEKGIETMIHYPLPLSLQPAYKAMGYSEAYFPVVSQVTKEILSLPLYPEMGEEMLEYVVESIKEFFKVKI